MTTTTEERLGRIDREVESLKQGFVDAVEHLQQQPEVDSSHDDRWTEIAQRVRALRTELRAEDYDKEQITALLSTLLDIRDLMDGEPDMDSCDQLLIGLERIRHIVRDALDEHVTGVARDVGLVMEDLDTWLPNTPRHQLAELVGVDRRTLARWTGKAAAPTRRLQTVARLVAILRHNWTEEGVIAWFHRPRRDLDGRTPLAILNDRNYDEDALISSARAGRSHYAS